MWKPSALVNGIPARVDGELYGLGYGNCDAEDAHYEKVSIEEMHAAIRKFLQPTRCVISTVSPQ